MDYAELTEFCLSLPGSCKDYPFEPPPMTAVFKNSKKKIFCLVMENTQPLHIMLKCDPSEAEFLRSQYASVKPGYHMNKKHWNSVYLDGSIPDGLIRQMVLNSYNLVCKNKESFLI